MRIRTRARLLLCLGLLAGSVAACDTEVAQKETLVGAAAAAPSALAALPADPIERAAMCQGAVTAKAVPIVRAGPTAGEAELLVVMHPAYIAASVSGEFDAARLQAVADKGPAYADRFRKTGGVEAVIGECHEAFPAMARRDRLPDDPKRSRRTCAALAGAMLESVQLSDTVRVGKAPAYARMLANIEEDVIRDFWKEGFAEEEAMRRAFRVSLAEAMTAAAPGALLEQCLQTYG